MWGQLKGIQRNYFDCPEMGLFDNMEEKSGHGNPDLQQLQCSGVVSHLLDCNVGEADYDNVEKNLYSEPNMFFMNSDTAVLNQSDWFGIDGEVPAVGVDGIEDVKRSCAASSEKVLEMKFGDSELCSTVSAESYQLGCLGSSVESCLQKEEDSNFEEILVNLVQNVETPMTSSLQIVPPGDCIQHKPHLDTKNDVEFSEEPVMDLQGAAEEKQDSLAGATDGLMSQSPHKEDNSCNIDEETLTVASDGCNEVSDSLHLPHLAADSSSGRDLVIDALIGAQIIPTVLYSTRLADIEGDGNLNNCSTTALTSVRRSTRRGKASKMRETNETAAGCRKTSKNKLPRGAIIRMPLKISRKKRSCSARCGRSSVWGLLGNVMQVFEENDGTQNHDTQLVQVENDRLRKRRDRRSHLTKDKCSTANGSHVRLNFRMGGKELEEDPSVVLPQVPDPPASLPTVVSKHPTEIDSHISSDVQELDDGLLHVLEKNVHDSRHLSQFTCLSEDLENQVVSPGAGVLDSQQGDKDLESTVTQDNSVGITFSDCPQLSCQRESVVLEETIQNRYSDLGTSPNSEVINSIQDVGVSSNAVLTSSQAAIDPTDAAAPDMTRMNTKRGKKHGKVKGTTYCSDGCIVVAEEKLLGHGKQSKTKKSAHKPRGKAKSSCNVAESYILETTGNASGKSSTLERWSSELLFVPENSRLEKSFEAETIIERCELSGEDVGLGHSELGTTDDLVKASKSKVPKRPSKSSTTSRRRTSIPDSGRSRRKNACEQKEAFQKSVNHRNAKEEDVPGQIVHDEENNRETDGSIDSFSGRKMHSESQRWEESSKMNVAGHDIPDNPGKFTVTGITSEDVLKSSMIANGLADQVLPLRKAWVLCDDCDKWRCISATLADSIEATNCRWTCKENIDKAFANCSIPQEKTNAEINAELEISDEEDAHGANVNPKRSEGSHLTVAQQAHWKPIDSNLFLHRSRKNQTIDEIMVCHCKPPQDGFLGCGDECLNRMLNIECVRGTCPCGDLCSNQQFQKRKYAKLECFRCGKKGHGLQLLENVFEGKFLIEYVGEVLDLNAYEARQGEYAVRGQRHFYFMTLNGSEVIDACAKGNLGRFINHSCDPNCRTEKWMVNGEVCIGLFAIRDIKKGEELTFDYNYVRVFGAAAKKCVCGSSECRGYIGGDPLNTETIVQSDSDEEFPEPIMVNEKVDTEVCMKKTDNFARITDGVSVQHSDTIAKLSSTHMKVELSLQKEDNIYRSNNACQPLEASVPLEDKVGKSVSIVQPIGMSSQTEVVLDGSLSSFPTSDASLQKEDIMCKNLSSSKSDEFTSPMIDSMRKSSDGCAACKNKPILSIDVDKPNATKAHRQMKSSCSSSSIKKGKLQSHLVSANRPEFVGNKPKKVLEGAVNDSLKGVEVKLNELLDADGGISKRKDSTKGYLKLLNFTANINGEAVQSIRDLSIILDALLKTRSRIVLVDIINKNGLQMLHNIMKQNRKNFNRTPILRKLLKVVKFLAEKEILTLEHINSGPHCDGVESFRESIFQLAKHDDIKVHQIARIFRDRWFPRTSRRGIYSNRDDVKLEFQGGINCNGQSSSYKRWHGQDLRPIETTYCSADATVAASQFDGDIQNGISSPFANYFITKSRKRKSRWDLPKEVKTNVRLAELMDDRKTKHRFQMSPQHLEIIKEGHDEVAQANIDEMCNGSDLPTEVASGVEAMLESCDDAPPGFASPLDSTLISSDGFLNTTNNLPPQTHDTRSDWEVNMGFHQERYLSHLPVSFGIPMVFVEQLGVSQSETMDSWTVAPSIPFHSFPPLPPYPRERRKIQLPSATMSREHDEVVQKHDHGAFRCEVDPSTSGTRPPDVVSTGASDQHMGKRMRSSSGGLGRRYFRQQKWNCRKYPPWVQRRIDGNMRQHISRSSASNVDLGNLENEKGGFCTEKVNGGGENVSSTYH